MALYVDYTSVSPSFCSADSACQTVQRAAGYIPITPLGAYVPWPAVGLFGFSLAFIASLLGDWKKRRRWTVGLCSAGALVAAGLVVVQAVYIGQYCLFCLAVDCSALVACAAAWFQRPDDWKRDTAEELGKAKAALGLTRPGWFSLGALALLVPFSWPHVKPTPPVPAKVAALYEPGKINVVEFADYQCPFCRRLHARLEKLLLEYGARVHFVRLNMPLESHEEARGAARVAVCAAHQGKGEAMADHLFETEDLGLSASVAAARDLGLDLRVFRTCLRAAETDAQIDAEAKILRDAGFQGLPTTFIGNSKIVGVRDDEVFREALDAAAEGEDPSGIPWWLFWPGAALLALGVGYGALLRPASGAEPGA
jgi:predicted DsbA family dithiol-disulfide isomerase